MSFCDLTGICSREMCRSEEGHCQVFQLYLMEHVAAKPLTKFRVGILNSYVDFANHFRT
jgi:hypothetical protein